MGNCCLFGSRRDPGNIQFKDALWRFHCTFLNLELEMNTEQSADLKAFLKQIQRRAESGQTAFRFPENFLYSLFVTTSLPTTHPQLPPLPSQDLGEPRWEGTMPGQDTPCQE